MASRKRKQIRHSRASRSRRSGHPSVPQRRAELAIDDLLFDQRNPRLPEDVRGGNQDELLSFIAAEYAPIEVARSIATHGYFPSEPLIVLQQQGRSVVVEGNRRLAALILLLHPEKAESLGLPDADEWTDLDPAVPIPEAVPVILADSREQVAPIIGYRHISGIEPWDPWAKARFIGGMIDDDRMSFSEVASLVGESERSVRESYRNYRAARQMERSFEIESSRVHARFGVFTRAMQDTNIRNFLGAPAAQDVIRERDPIPTKRAANVRQAISWLFGDSRNPAVITDSRQISDLGMVVAAPEALAELRSSRDLESAFALTSGIKQRLLTRLDRAISSLDAALVDIADYAYDEDVSSRLDDCESLVRRLRHGGRD